MFKFIDSVSNAIAGVLRGFDRLVFHGRHRRLQFTDGAEGFFNERGILFKDAKEWVQSQSQRIITDVERISNEATGMGITYIGSSRTRKEELARTRQAELGITEGIIGAWSCVEEGMTYQIQRAEGRPRLVPIRKRCKHVYLYLDHATHGFMSIRLQTWMPFTIQIALNGRESLGRSLERAGIAHERRHNKIISCDDFARAQAILDRQVHQTNWGQLLSRLVPLIFPSRSAIVGPEMAYTWYCWQSEWATDLIFSDMGCLTSCMEDVLLHAQMHGNADRIMRYFDRGTNANGLLRQNAAADITSHMIKYADGLRLRHWLNGNSVKIYNQFNNMRIETTINNPGQFKMPRPMGPQSITRAVPLRKGIQDLRARAKISNSVNERTLDSLQACREKRSIGDIIAATAGRKTIAGRQVRALQVFDKDAAILQAVAKQEFRLTGLTNAMIRKHLKTLPQYKNKTDKQIAGIVTRSIRLLRDHGLLRKYPKQHRYQLNDRGTQLTDAVQSVLAADISRLMATAA